MADINNPEQQVPPQSSQSGDPDESAAQQIIQEDEDITVDEGEITRIIKLYLGREPFPEEMDRFLGMQESELKILTDYLNQRREEEKMNFSANKVKNELALKGIKAFGENQINGLKSNPMMPPRNMPMPNFMPSQPNMNAINVNEGNAPSRSVRDGRYSLVKFA